MQRIACVYVAHFVAELESQRHEPRVRPLIVSDGTHVLDACPRASTMGVAEGELLSRALAHCPDALMVPADPHHYRQAWEALLELLADYSPRVDAERWGVAYLEATGMGRLYGGEEAWCEAIRQRIRQGLYLKAQVGVGATRFVSWLAANSARFGSGYRIISGDEREYLASFSVDWLPLSKEALRRLGLLGIHTIGRFADLSPTQVAEQFGAESLLAHRLARAQDRRPVAGRRQQVVEAHVEFQAPEARLDPLRDALLAASRRPLADLKRRGLAVTRVEVEARFADGEAATRSTWAGDLLGPRKLSDALERLLAGLPGSGYGVMEAWVRLIGLEPWTGKQLDLFSHTHDRLHLEATLRKLARKHSAECVAQARLVAPHIPLPYHRYDLQKLRS